MKAMKKLFALLLALTMVFGLAATAFAAGEIDGTGESGFDATKKGKIVINDAIKDVTYTAYKIFNLETFSDSNSDDATEGNYSYVLPTDSPWTAFFTTGAGKDYITISTDGHNYVTWTGATDDTSKASFAKAALEYAKNSTNNVPVAATAKAAANATAEAPLELGVNADTKAPELDLGWYLVDTSLGALCSLGTTDYVAEIVEKNEGITPVKQVKEDNPANGTDEWGDKNTADIGDTVEFKVTIPGKAGSENWTLHDSMTDGLDFDETSVVVYKGSIADENIVPETETVESATVTNYELKTTSLCTANAATKDKDCDFHIEFGKAFLDKLTSSDTVIVTYKAVVTASAKIDYTTDDPTSTNLNDTRLQYGTNTYSEWDETETHVFELNVWKYKDTNGTTAGGETALENAYFVLYKKGTAENTYQLLKATQDTSTKVWKPANDTNGKHWTDAAALPTFPDTLDGITAVTDYAIFKSESDGYIKIDGLDADTYYLKEIKTPDGFNKLENDIKVVIADDGTVTYYELNKDGNAGTVQNEITKDSNEHVITVLNQSGKELPSTGGVGTTLFYVFGGLMVVGAAVLLVTKKRMSV